jgi:arsenate reductase-like glutaredoxin family protein
MENSMDVTFYGLKSCDTCKKALKALRDSGHIVTYVDVRTNGVGADKLAKFQCFFGESLTNKRSATWRGLSETERLRPALQLLLEYPTLMKRPVIDADGDLSLGWGEDVQNRFRA